MGKVRSGVINDINNLLESIMNKGYQYNECAICEDDYSDNDLSLVRKFLHDMATSNFLDYY